MERTDGRGGYGDVASFARRRGAICGILVAAALCGVLTGCMKATEPYRDAPRGTTNSGPADVLTFPDGFSNIAAKCDGTTRVYVAFHGDANRSAIAAVPNAPQCAGGTR